MRSKEIQRMLDSVEERYGSVKLYGSSPDEEHGTCFVADGVSATFSLLTFDGSLPADTFDLQVEGIPPGDYLYRARVSTAELLQLMERFGEGLSRWPR